MRAEGRTIGGKFARCRVMHDPALRDDEAAVDAVGKGADVTVGDQGGHPAEAASAVPMYQLPPYWRASISPSRVAIPGLRQFVTEMRI